VDLADGRKVTLRADPPKSDQKSDQTKGGQPKS
jgi:hypothetical protein